MLPSESNPGLFLVTVDGDPNTTVYDITLAENVAGLKVLRFVNPAQSDLDVQPNLVQYRAGNISSKKIFSSQ